MCWSVKFVSALNRKLFHISDHRVVRQLVESLTEVALKLIMHETSIRDLVEKVPVVRFASIAGKSIYWMVPGFLFTATVAAKAPVAARARALEHDQHRSQHACGCRTSRSACWAASSVVLGLIIGEYFSWKMTLWMVLITPAELSSKVEHIVFDSISKMKTIRAEWRSCS